jgi:glycosyltransferase involved in cell wall biosynthesis
VIIKDPTGKFAIPATYLVARLRRKPFLFWASLSEHPTNGLHRFTRPLMRYLYRRADGVLTYGRHVSRHVIAEGARPDRVIVAPQAVRSFVGATPDAERWRQPLQLLYVGRLEPWKGLHVLIHALGLLGGRSWRLRVAGRGAQEGALRDQARALGVGDSVEFLGHVPNRSLPALYASSAVLIVPSIRTPSVTEVWALVVNEAMQAGALVMASDCIGAVQDGLVRDQQTGLVFREGDPASLAQQLALVTDPARAASLRRIATAGQQEIARYSFDEAAAAFVTAARRASTGQAVDSRTGSLTGRR